MQIIKLDATDSTNKYLKDLMNSEELDDYTVILAEAQLSGRGQLGTKWESETGKNLTFSVLKKMDSLHFPNLFMINICISLAIETVLGRLNVPDLKIKWPNDILSGTSKICGILIENMISGSSVNASVIGIGLNVNQIEFKNLPKVSSLRLLLGSTISLEELLHSILSELKTTFDNYTSVGSLEMEKKYEQLLFRKDKPSTFKDKDGEMFMGFIRGVSQEGKLLVTLEDEITKEFNLKELSLLY